MWPTNASNYLTSSFCEYRPGHYHSAIDIKTWNQEGYPIYAIDDGKIYRIRVSPFGYGKVIYLKLKDGNFAVYGHLQKFTHKIDSTIRQKQLENKKYRLSWYPKNWSVKKGEIIGYTGSTGTGTPHLHFEIRNSKEQPLNPLAFYSKVKDNTCPRLQKIALVPLSYDGTVNNSFLPQIFNLKYIKDAVYVITSPLRVSGRVGLALKGYDLADDVYNKLAFYQTTMSVESDEVFQITYDIMDFTSTSYINTEIYYHFRSKFNETFHKLYIESFNILPFYKSFTHTDGSIVVKDKPIAFTISVKDFSGNTSIISGELLPEPDDKIEINQKFYKDGWAYIKFTVKSYNFLSFSSSSDLSNWKAISYFDFLDRKFENSKHTLFIKLKIPDLQHQYLRIETQSLEGKKIQKLINLAEIDSLPAPLVYFSDKKIVLESNYIGDKFLLKTGDIISELPSLQSPQGTSQAAIPINKFITSDLEFGVNSGDSTLWLVKFDIRLIEPKVNKTVTWFDSSIVINSYANSFFDTTFIQVKVHEWDSIGIDLPAKNNIFEILPDDIALLNSVSVFIQSDSLIDSNQWGIYKKNGEQKFSFLSANYDSARNGFRFRTESFGQFIIAQDTLPPVLEIQSPDSDKHYQSNPNILFTTYDEHSSIGNEENIIITIDGQFVLPEWDPEEETVAAIIDTTLSPGKHKLLIEVRDQCGNISQKVIPFSTE
ncbi:M23 family metallopeptidase [Calditrichota bacterium]